jgi:hypothetical protein
MHRFSTLLTSAYSDASHRYLLRMAERARERLETASKALQVSFLGVPFDPQDIVFFILGATRQFVALAIHRSVQEASRLLVILFEGLAEAFILTVLQINEGISAELPKNSAYPEIRCAVRSEIWRLTLALHKQRVDADHRARSFQCRRCVDMQRSTP